MMATVAILGGGVSGLSAAYYLSRIGSTQSIRKIILLESSDRLGGWVSTTKYADGAVYEHGPRTMRLQGPQGINTLELVDDLGLSKNILQVQRSSPAAQNRFLYVNKELCALPKGLGGVLWKQPPFSRSILSQVWKEPFCRKSSADDESIHDFATRRLSPELAKYAIDAVCRGIFAGNSRHLSVKSCFPPLYNWEKEYGSITKGALKSPKVKVESQSLLVNKLKEEKTAVWSLRNGLQELTDTLAEELRKSPNVTIKTSSPCMSLSFMDQGVKVKTGSEEYLVDHVWSACYSRALSGMLDPEQKELAGLLSSINAVSVGNVNLEYPGQVMPVEGFGHLIPSCEGNNVLGVIYDSCSFPELDSTEKTTRFTCMMGGAWFEELFGDVNSMKADDFIPLAIEAIREQLGIRVEPVRVQSNLQKDCIPQYEVGHFRKMDAVDSYIASHSLPLILIGSSYHGVSVNDCIFNAKKAAETFIEHLKAKDL